MHSTSWTASNSPINMKSTYENEKSGELKKVGFFLHWVIVIFNLPLADNAYKMMAVNHF